MTKGSNKNAVSRKSATDNHGFSLIELLVVIVVIGILTAVAMQSMDVAVDDVRSVKTEREMEMLAKGIAGDPSITDAGGRADFGYVGDVGGFPPNLQALYRNPGGYATWNGPYIPPEFVQDSTGFKTDEWGALYSYNGGIAIRSTGSGATISKKIADATSDYVLNSVNGYVVDGNDSLPGTEFADSVDVVITIPDGSGGTITKFYTPDSTGAFILDSLPVGRHPLRVIYTPEVDTLFRYLTVLPRHKSPGWYKFSSIYFSNEEEGPSGAVGYWPLDDSTGSVAHDVSGHHYDGTLYNIDTTIAWSVGMIDGALEFDGSNDYVQIPHTDSLNGDTALTYTAWVYPHTWSGTRQVMAKSVHGGGSGRVQMGIFSESGNLRGRAEATSGRWNVDAPLPTLNTWSHLALVFDGTSLQIFVNGMIEDSLILSPTTLKQNSDPLSIGKRVGTPQYFFNGMIDDVRVYTRSLTAAEILAMYNIGVS